MTQRPKPNRLQTPQQDQRLDGAPQNRIIDHNPFDPPDPTTNSEPKAKARSRKRRADHSPTEKEFQDTFLQVAEAGSWHRRFHVIDQGASTHTRRIIAQLRQAGMHEAAELVARTGRPKVTAPGFPDWNLQHDQHGIIVAELKSDRASSNATDEQWAWLIAYAYSLRPPDNPYAPSRAHLWRPQHWPAIETQLHVTPDPKPCQCDVCNLLRADPNLEMDA